MGRTGFDKAKTVLRVTSDNFLEVYDFFLFGIYARLIGQIFFPSDDPRRLTGGVGHAPSFRFNR